MNVIDRVFEIIDAQDSSVYKFEKSHGISGGYLNRVKKNGTYLGEQIIVEILNKNPDLSADWLLRGKGSMWMSADRSDSDDVPTFDEDYYRKTIAEKDARINELMDTIIKMALK